MTKTDEFRAWLEHANAQELDAVEAVVNLLLVLEHTDDRIRAAALGALAELASEELTQDLGPWASAIEGWE